MPLSLHDALEDISSRFFANLPAEELKSFERIFVQLQEASWFYTDFYSDRHPSLPKLELKAFCLKFFKFSPFLRPHLSKFDELFSNFWKYLGSVPVCGGAILSECLTQVLLVRSWQSQHWGFPKGKINQGETELDCAIRETMEEVGFDGSEVVDRSQYLESKVRGKTIHLYVMPGVPLSHPFRTETRKEISEIKWFRIDSLPIHSNAAPAAEPAAGVPKKKKLFGVIPFVSQLRTYVEVNWHLRAAPLSSSGGAAATPLGSPAFMKLVSMVGLPCSPMPPPGGGGGKEQKGGGKNGNRKKIKMSQPDPGLPPHPAPTSNSRRGGGGAGEGKKEKRRKGSRRSSSNGASGGGGGGGRSRRSSGSDYDRGEQLKDEETFADFKAFKRAGKGGAEEGWSVEDMYRHNEAKFGVKSTWENDVDESKLSEEDRALYGKWMARLGLKQAGGGGGGGVARGVAKQPMMRQIGTRATQKAVPGSPQQPSGGGGGCLTLGLMCKILCRGWMRA